MKEITTEEALRYNRQILMPGFDLERQERLLSSRALIIGGGGLGCSVAQFLCASGVGTLSVIDDDNVELTNLPRQILHTEADVGKPKVASIKAALAMLNSKTKVIAINDRAIHSNLSSLVKEHDIVLDCSDNLETRNLINSLSYQFGVPLVSGAAIQMHGQVFCSMPSEKSACYACISRYFNAPNLSCMESGVMSPLVGIIGATQAIEAIKILSGFGKTAINKLQLYDAMQSEWQTINIKKHANCYVCN